DIVVEPLVKMAARCNVPMLHFDLVRCPLPDHCIDVAVLLNVLEHIEDDVGAIRQLYRILKPGGSVVVEVPAGPHLYDIYDRVLMHWRRYRCGDLCAALQKAGFEITYRSHLGFFLYPAFRRVKRRNARHLTEDPASQRKRVEREIHNTRTSHLMAAALAM